MRATPATAATPATSRDALDRTVEQLFPLPLTGRDTELSQLAERLESARAGAGGMTLIAGEGGVGKSRLIAALAKRAAGGNWTVGIGRAYPVETGVPYAVFADALAQVVGGLAPAALAVLTRGDMAGLASICPAFGPSGLPGMPPDTGDAKARLLWSFVQFLGRLSAQQPLLLVLENLHWADASSLELLHFVARQSSEQHIAVVGTYNEAELEANPTLRATEQSLLAVGAATRLQLEPLGADALHVMIRDHFRADDASARALTRRLFERTRGNPYFTEELLKALVTSGALRQRDGVWSGWDADPPDLPRSVRDAVAQRLARLSGPARALGNLAAVVGTRTTHAVLAAVSGVSASALLSALDELRRQGVLKEEAGVGDMIQYEFAHPLVREVLYADLGMARRRMLHGDVATALESLHGARTDEHADELAFHFSRAESRALAGKAVRYLAHAGWGAVARHANREAADYLSAALAQCDAAAEAPDAATDDRERNSTGADARMVDVDALVESLARVLQRLGDYERATTLWLRARESAWAHRDERRLAAIERRLGLASYWSGHHEEALRHFESALDAATRAGDEPMLVRVRVARAMTRQARGDPAAARTEVDAAFALAERLDNPALMARVHRASLLLHIFVGPAERAYADGARAIAAAEQAGERGVEWSAHWALATMGGLSGNGAAMTRHLSEGERLAEQLGSPVLRCWMAEIAIEYASGAGDWDAGLALAARTIPLARTLGQRMLLPRLLVWTAMIQLHRGHQVGAKALLDEALTLVGHAGRSLLDVHSAAPVHAGLAAWHIAMGDHRRAIEVGTAGLALVDRTGYIAWGVHRLLPGIIEAALWIRDFDTAERHGARLRRDSTQLGHQLGLAWADTCDAMIRMLRDDHAGAIPLLRRGADALDAVPWVLDAARVRRNLGWVLGITGERDEAARELRRAHDVFLDLGAEPELARTREVIRELGIRPPSRSQTAGVGALTGREVDIVVLAAAHKSNKEIGAALGISPRTVSTHLSSIFGKLDVTSRGQLADVARREGLVAR